MEENRRGKVLRQVRALLDKASSTQYPAERDALIAKADQMMAAYTIESWELEMAKPANAREKPELIDYDYGSVGDNGVDNSLSDIFYSLASLCGVKVGYFGWSKSKIVGYKSDLEYLDLLFTNVRLHLTVSIVPRPDPEMSYEENLALLKETGYKWQQVYELMVPMFPERFQGALADPERVANDRSHHERFYPKTKWEESAVFYRHYIIVGGKTYYRTIPRKIGVRFTGEYTRFCRDQGRQRIYADPSVYRRSFASAYALRLEARVRDLMVGRAEAGSGKELVLANRDDDLKEFLFECFPDLRPHPRGCECDICHARKCSDRECNRPKCKEKRKPVRHKLPAELKTDMTAWERGRSAAEEVDLMGSRNNLSGRRRELSP